MKNNIRDKVICPDPKCKSPEIRIFEVSEILEYWTQDASGKLEPMPEDEKLEYGNILRVEAHCSKCGKIWTVRGVSNITELPNWKQNEELVDTAPAAATT